ncbi:hypothetical protein AQUCO_00400586v1 [Aquilegia coerulea]|uniref:Uncharacterized protein n=1 Tax=Aquilegia coerulea TaxID=218851 RepID=A0A2G5EVL5_AQUCA|nr:hypothetical protein AQUCO_00400586v1 [Aquilegia coerulea]
MEDSTIISTLCKTLTSFCNHVQSSSQALKDSMERRPIPLDSASSTFIQLLNRRVSSASNDLNLLESMAFGTVSFEELLGHCNELYKKNQTDLLQIEDRFKDFGYVPAIEIDEEEYDDDVSGLKTPKSKLIKSNDGLNLYSMSCGRSSVMKRLEEDPLLDESLSLQNLGLSDVCLATLASEADNVRYPQEPKNYDNVKPIGEEEQHTPAMKFLSATGVDLKEDSKSIAATKVINISKDDYQGLPSFMTSLASWQDLSEAVDKMNSFLLNQQASNNCDLFHQDKLSSLGLGPKVRSYLLILLRLHHLVVETVDGAIVYRVL